MIRAFPGEVGTGSPSGNAARKDLKSPARFLRFTILFACISIFSAGSTYAAPVCPKNAAQAEQFILVLSPSMTSTKASVRYFERRKGGGWQPVGERTDAVLGRNGLGWSWAFERYASGSQPIKKEGDRRTPAGFFTVGRAFGFSSAKRRNYVRLEKGEQFCVDDPASPHYNQIVRRAKAGKAASGEDMATISLYREGLFLDYPTNRKAKGGSCIFVHVWRKPTTATLGCVALSESGGKEMQSRAASRQTIIAILPKKAWERIKSCFPGVTQE